MEVQLGNLHFAPNHLFLGYTEPLVEMPLSFHPFQNFSFMQQWMILLWLLWITMFIAKQETNGLKFCGSHIEMIRSQNTFWGHLRTFNLIAC